MHGGRLSLILWASSKTRNGPLLAPTFWIGMGPLAMWCAHSKNGPPPPSSLQSALFSQFVPPFWGRKHESWELRKSYETPNESTQSAHRLKHEFYFYEFASCQRKSARCIFFKLGALIFGLFSTICGTLKKNLSLGAILHGPRGPFEDHLRPIPGKGGVVFFVCGVVCVCVACHGVVE